MAVNMKKSCQLMGGASVQVDSTYSMRLRRAFTKLSVFSEMDTDQLTLNTSVPRPNGRSGSGAEVAGFQSKVSGAD